jgi:hypothetical protein
MELLELKKNQFGTGVLNENDGYIDINDIHNKTLKESIGDPREWQIPFPFIVHAVFQKADTPNANGRIYPREILDRELNKYMLKCSERRGYGQCDHPADIVISTKELSHNIIKLWWEGKTIVGDMEIIISPGFIKYGIASTVGDNVANSIYFNKLKLGVSSRGVGSVESKSNMAIVQEDFELLCWDIVSDPSTPNAYIDMNRENLQPYIETKIIDPKKQYIIESIDKVLLKNW